MPSFSFPYFEYTNDLCYAEAMKLTAVVRLHPTVDQYSLLLKTVEQANAACNNISQTAWEAKTFSRASVYPLTYYPIRERYELTAQMAVRCIGKVVDAYKVDKKTQRVFHRHGAVPHDERILAWNVSEKRVSIWTLAGREIIPFVCSDHHCISKQLVKRAKDIGRGIALEDLTHIRTRVTVHKPRRDELHIWAFADLRFNIAYKAERAGIPVEIVDARYTSQQCSCCGHTSRSNRPTQSSYKCVACGFVSHADYNAAVNISRRASLSPPYAVCVLGTQSHHNCKFPVKTGRS